MGSKKWQLFPPIRIEELARFAPLPSLVVQLLYNRGLSPSQFESFLEIDDSLLADPFLLPDMEVGVSRLCQALTRQEKIAVYGDFDVDGIAATVLLSQGLAALGAQVTPYIPHRFDEGYGLNHGALARLAQEGVKLVITVDCGISDFEEVERAQGMGLDIIITDHHTVPELLPPAFGVINPKRIDSTYPSPYLSGVGVAFKFLQGICQVQSAIFPEDALDMVALGTVADLSPLVGENRYLVKRGLEALNSHPRPGIHEMALGGGMAGGTIDTEAIAYFFGPRLNAAGRLDHAIASYHLLATSSFDQAQQWAMELEKKNQERQRLTEEALAKAQEQLPLPGVEGPLVLVGGYYNPGIIGIVAGKLAEERYLPAVVLSLGPEVSRGSGRSIPEFDLIAALRQCRDLLLRYGGHALAAGFTLATSQVASLDERLKEIAAQKLGNVDLRPTVMIDAEVDLSQLRGDTFQWINRLAPFGYGNPSPTFLSRGVTVMESRSVGNRGEHLKLKLRDGKAIWDAIGFDLMGQEGNAEGRLDIVYNLGVDRWRDNPTLQLQLLDFAPSP